MAYFALSSLAQTIDLIFNHHQYSISPQQKQQLISIQEHVISLQKFLENFPEKADGFRGRIRDAATEAEDIIEHAIWKHIRSFLRKSKTGLSAEDTMSCNFKAMKSLMEKFDSIAAEVIDINNHEIKDGHPDKPLASTSSSRPGKDEMVGFDDDLLALKARLCGESSKLQVIPIVGMGGIGKTTLARNAYNDALIDEHFYTRVWVTVSQEYRAEEILSSLKDSLKVSNDIDVYKSLKGRRYLIVLDDMWSTKAWDDVKRLFPNDKNGSRIILTTRILDVATYAASTSLPHEIQFMDVEQSWNLLQKKAFGQENCPPQLEAIGKEIARSCKGLPLAIVTIAGVLSTVGQTQTSWEDIARNANQGTLTTNDKHFAGTILSLSYNHLPQQLRQCFLYTGAFPEDYEIQVSKLVKLWIAEGFLNPSGSRTLEECAEECLEDLVRRSLLLVNERKVDGKIKTCSIHDLVRELCIRKAREEKFLMADHKFYKHILKGKLLPETIQNLRRVSVSDSKALDHLESTYGSSLRAIICFNYRRGSSIASLASFKLLRVLVILVAVTSIPFPDELFHLFHLRYLALDHIIDIPPAISNLQNLQTLVIYPKSHRMRGTYSVYLPPEIWKMTQLRHLLSSSFRPFPILKGKSRVLENLQTLSRVCKLVCDTKILKMIPNVKKLSLYYSFDQNSPDYLLNNLVHLRQLEKLSIEAFNDYPPKTPPVFPETLKNLTLSRLRMYWKDAAIVSSLPNLEVLKVKNYAFRGDTWETTEGGFPRLKLLHIDVSYLKNWITESSHFPSLKCLQLHSCPALHKIPDSIGDISALELIEVDKNIKTIVDSARRMLKEQRSYGNYILQVRTV